MRALATLTDKGVVPGPEIALPNLNGERTFMRPEIAFTKKHVVLIAASEDNGVNNTFSGRSQTWVADFIYKWAPNGNAKERYLKLQGEYLWRRESGELAYNITDAGAETTSDARFRQSGGYLQAVYQFMPHWRVGVRGDWLRSGTANLGTLGSDQLPILASHNPTRQTAMVDWSPSEFSRLRLQLARDKSRNGEADNQVWLQYVMSLGAHGAHKF